MLEAVPTNIFSSTFRVQQNDKLLGEVSASIWRDKARLQLEDGTYDLYRVGQFGGDFVIEHNGKLLARATKPSVFQNRFAVEVANQRLVLGKIFPVNPRVGVFGREEEKGDRYLVARFSV